MARKSTTGGSEGGKIDTEQNAKLEDIYTAAKSTMEAADYSSGWPAQPGNLRQGVWQGRLLTKGGEKD
jgi:hypothetical protein